MNPQLRIRRGFVVGPGGMNGMPVMNMNAEWKHSAPAVQDGFEYLPGVFSACLGNIRQRLRI